MDKHVQVYDGDGRGEPVGTGSSRSSQLIDNLEGTYLSTVKLTMDYEEVKGNALIFPNHAIREVIVEVAWEHNLRRFLQNRFDRGQRFDMAIDDEWKMHHRCKVIGFTFEAGPAGSDVAIATVRYDGST